MSEQHWRELTIHDSKGVEIDLCEVALSPLNYFTHFAKQDAFGESLSLLGIMSTMAQKNISHFVSKLFLHSKFCWAILTSYIFIFVKSIYGKWLSIGILYSIPLALLKDGLIFYLKDRFADSKWIYLKGGSADSIWIYLKGKFSFLSDSYVKY